MPEKPESPPPDKPRYPAEPSFTILEQWPNAPEEMIRPLKVLGEMHQQTDRGAAIIGAAFVESFLENSIKSRWKDLALSKSQTLFDRLFKGYGPLSSFSAKIDIAFAIQLIGNKTYRDLHIIREIRNAFAHHIEAESVTKPVTFQNRSIADKCKNLWHPKNGLALVKSWSEKWDLKTPRGLYMYAIFTIPDVIRNTEHCLKESGAYHLV